ncbi:TlpA family protein disulfide reductase [Algoriphagus aquimarinus]|uniref:TlpA family protein disulfide reductase n=1 Tax=Algoriphagus aquimarinus TaxID=237018 RepID=A0A5C7AEP9_9BACT|nr:TlpA disulfide reductase family protein [Algoriphagus aquimarinus]TXE06424.1 TlpA family protein disulfide reductase [Algoriphagus aquimarinus]
MGKNNSESKNALSRIICLGILVISFFGCKPKQEDQAQLVLVLEDSVVYDYLSSKKASINFLGENSLPDKIEFPSDTSFTHFTVAVNNDWSELVYIEKDQPVYNYIFQKGDTVLLKIRERKPWMQVVNRTTKKYDINWEASRNRDLIKREDTSLEDFYFLWNSSFNSLIPVNMESELQITKVSAMAELDREKYWLDSLVNDGLLSKPYSKLLEERNRFESYKIGFFDIEKGYFDALNATQDFLSDSTFEKYHIYIVEYAEFLLEQLINQHPNRAEEIIGEAANSYFSQLMLYNLIKMQVHELSFAEIDQLLTINSSKLPNEWERTLRAPIAKLLNQDPDMELLGLGQKRLTIDELLAEERGKYLYVDLWAAWCIPCIRSFPAAKKLQSDYQDKGIQVIYLSVDKNNKFWQEVVRKYDIAIPDKSFIVMNIDESEYLKELNVNLIPRYLLFDTEGKLIHPNAPRPESSDIRVLLDSLSS